MRYNSEDMTAVQLRDQALMMLEGKGAILDVALRVSRVLEEQSISGGVVGGVAVVLHGHIRTTVDVDVYTAQHKELAAALRANGFEFDPAQREFRYGGVPVHLVTREQAPVEPSVFEQIEDVRVVCLADLISMKLHSGTRNLTRAQDIADVIGLIRHHHLTGEFARHIYKPLRNEFRKLARAVKKESS